MSTEIWLLAGIVLLMMVAAALVVMTRQASKLAVTKADFTQKGRAPVRVALISDLHISKMPIHWDYIATKISKADPDFVVVAGDLIFSKKDGPAVLSFFTLLVDYVYCPIYVTYGNHDNNKLFYHDAGRRRAFSRELENISSRIRIVENEHFLWEEGSQKVEICGLSDFRLQEEGAKERRLDVLEEARQEAFGNMAPLLVVSHNPRVLTELPEGFCDLALFGHYHDGQVHLPGRAEFHVLRPHDTLACAGYIYGSYEYRGTPIYITSGLGNTNLAIRYKSTPEVAIITF